MTRATAKLYGWKLTGKWQICEHCTQAKIRQQNIGHGSNQPSKVKGERLYIDVSNIKGRSYGGTKFWNLIVDEATRMKWSVCLKQKSDLGKEMVKFLRELHKKDKVTVKYIRCDNSGENKKLMELCKTTNGLAHIHFKFTARNTPQQNGVVERAFTTLYRRIRE